MKNQMEIILARFMNTYLPENNLKNDKDHRYYRGPENRPLE